MPGPIHDVAPVAATSPPQPGSTKSVSFSTTDHTKLLDLLLQEVAMFAREAVNHRYRVETKQLAEATKRTLTVAREVLAAVAIRDSAGPTTKQLFSTLDGAVITLMELHEVWQDEKLDPGFAKDVLRVLVDLHHVFRPHGWKLPVEKDTQARKAAAQKAGALTLSTPEKAELGRLHLRASRQHLLGGWSQITAGGLASVANDAKRELHAGLELLQDPNIATETARAEIESLEQVLHRVIAYLESTDKASLTQLKSLAIDTDAARQILDLPPKWSARLTGTPSQPIASNQPAGPAGLSNEIDRGPPRAEPPEHRGDVRQTFRTRVYIVELKHGVENLGFIEIEVVVRRMPGGQIYIADNGVAVTPRFYGRASKYLSIQVEPPRISSDRIKGEHDALLGLSIKVNGPNTTATKAHAVSGKVVGSNVPKTAGVEAQGTYTETGAVTSQAFQMVKRGYRIRDTDGDSKDDSTPQLQMDEIEGERVNFGEWEIHGDDLGGLIGWKLMSWSHRL